MDLGAVFYSVAGKVDQNFVDKDLNLPKKFHEEFVMAFYGGKSMILKLYTDIQKFRDEILASTSLLEAPLITPTLRI